MTRHATLKANPAMAEALALQSLDQSLQVLRRRMENDPSRYGGFRSKINKAADAITGRRVGDARDEIAALTRGFEEKDLAVWVRESLEEGERLGDQRHAPTAKSEAGPSTRDGFLWLVNRNRYTSARVEAGRHFREKYERARSDSVKSCLNDTPGGRTGEGPSASFSHARFELKGVRDHFHDAIGEASGESLYRLLESVCGEGETVRQLAKGEDRKADGLVIELGFALDMAGVYFGLVRK